MASTFLASSSSSSLTSSEFLLHHRKTRLKITTENMDKMGCQFHAGECLECFALVVHGSRVLMAAALDVSEVTRHSFGDSVCRA
jgi:hypothetical protein